MRPHHATRLPCSGDAAVSQPGQNSESSRSLDHRDRFQKFRAGLALPRGRRSNTRDEVIRTFEHLGSPVVRVKMLAIRKNPMKAETSIFAALSCAVVLCSTSTGPAIAGMVSGWWGGDWTCNIDGRPARMRWFAADNSSSSCNGDVCTRSSGVRWRGRFSDNGSRWVALTNPRQGDKSGLFFRHADGNQWYLPKPHGTKTTGWTTWNGQRYQLSCWR
jgi:hypothetical protein